MIEDVRRSDHSAENSGKGGERGNHPAASAMSRLCDAHGRSCERDRRPVRVSRGLNGGAMGYHVP